MSRTLSNISEVRMGHEVSEGASRLLSCVRQKIFVNNLILYNFSYPYIFLSDRVNKEGVCIYTDKAEP